MLANILLCDRQKTTLFTMGGAESGNERIIGKEERHQWLRVENCAKTEWLCQKFSMDFYDLENNRANCNTV
jgi:hypothetical protein